MSKIVYAYCISVPGQLSKKKQVELMKEQGVSQHNIYFDKISGNGSERAVFNVLMDVIMPGDLLYVKSVDVLGDDYSDVIE